jgi:hypothetical protein
LGLLRKLITRASPALAARMESESRTWMMQCPTCGHERSVWDAGGIRYKASGTVWRLGRCSNCQKLGMLRIYRHEDTDSGP